jgi:SNF2 family DNA or RNA helicase
MGKRAIGNTRRICSAISRRMIQEYEFYFTDENLKRLPKAFKFEALITTYEMILTDAETLQNIPWRCVVIDEAHRLKNRNCKLLSGLSQFKMVCTRCQST